MRRPAGSRVSADSLTLAGVALDTLGGTLIAEDTSHARFTVGAQSHNGPLGVAGGTWSLLKNSWAVGLTSLDLVVGKDEWRLAGPARLERDSIGTRLDSLILRNRDTAVVAMSGDVPTTGNVTGRVRATNLPLDDIGVHRTVRRQRRRTWAEWTRRCPGRAIIRFSRVRPRSPGCSGTA